MAMAIACSRGPPGESIDQVVQRQELRDLVRRCIDQLPDSYRTVLLLRDIEELSTEETAKLLGTNAGVVKTRLHRARQALRTLLDPYFGGGHPGGGGRRMTCREFIDFLNDYVDGALPTPQRHFFDTAPGRCLYCQTYLESYKRTVRLGKLLADGDGEGAGRRAGVLVQAILSATCPRPRLSCLPRVAPAGPAFVTSLYDDAGWEHQ